MPSRRRCSHPTLQTVPSSHAASAGFVPRTSQQLFTAATGSRKRITPEYAQLYEIYPAPLVLPDDELAYDPKYPPQSFTSWLNLKERNDILPERRTVYIAEAPGYHDSKTRKIMDGWDVPDQKLLDTSLKTNAPSFDDVHAYLQAFFHGLPVEKLPHRLDFTTTESLDLRAGSRNKRTVPSRGHQVHHSILALTSASPEHLNTSHKVTTPIETRPSKRSTPQSPSPYPTQLSLNSLLDHAIAILPPDAYALLLLVNHDLYEDEDDDFCVGRAYGGSRVAVVSRARYLPALDWMHSVGVDWDGEWEGYGHIWPGSHCEAYVKGGCGETVGKVADGKKTGKENHLEKSDGVKSVRATQRKKTDDTGTGTSREDAITLDDSILEDQHMLELDSLQQQQHHNDTPLNHAISAHKNSPIHSLHPTTQALHSLYTARLALTASHELLHCFGFDHCVYQACAMQGTASVAEDARQPPYLCAVCENKLGYAIVGSHVDDDAGKRRRRGGRLEGDWWSHGDDGREMWEWRGERVKKLIEVCGRLGLEGLKGWYGGFEKLIVRGGGGTT